MAQQVRHRGCCHGVLRLPVNLSFLPSVKAAQRAEAETKPRIPMVTTVLLAFAFVAGWTVVGTMIARLPWIFEATGATSLEAVAAGLLIGPAPVLARMAEAGILS